LKGDDYTGHDGILYPRGGFIQDFPANNKSESIILSSELQSGNWIDKATRIVLLSFSLANENLNEAIITSLLEFKFSSIGDVKSKTDVVVMNRNRYYFDFKHMEFFSVALLLIEISCLVFVCYEFVYTEIFEIIESFQKLKIREEKKTKMKGYNINLRGFYLEIPEYFFSIWNYYEWIIILISCWLVWCRWVIVREFSEVNLRSDETYLDLHSQSLWVSQEKYWLSIFILMNWIRLLKFLRYMSVKRIGAVVQSIMDTLASSSVIIFLFVLLYVVATFALCFHIAFGTHIGGYSAISDSVFTLFLFLFGNSDFDSLEDASRSFGRFFFSGEF